MKKHNWIRYGRQNDIVEITVRDASGGRIDYFKCNNKKDYKRILKIVRDKYGFDFAPEIEMEKKVDFDKEKSKWLKKDFEW